ncbi:MAG: TlpA family protein disulfide reductase [Nanoarchaeota archaeon]|nr:TlpA family protein disulfide reductase [Nanoarchaeota archaeon]
MAKNKKNIVLGVVVIIIIVAIIIIQNPFQQSETPTGVLQNNENTGIDIGNLAPDFILNSLEGNNVQLSSFRGKKAVVVNFWATWCPPCREEMPAFEDMFIRNKDKLEVLGVNLQESERAISNFLLEIPVTYPLLLDPDIKVKELYNIFTQPVTYFVDKDGIIVDKKFGPLTPKEIEDKFGKLGIQ